MGLFLLGAPAALAIGFAADAWHRVRLMTLILVVGGGASLGTATASSYAALFWWRALTGVSLGAALPVTFSLLADLFPPSRRTSISGRVGIAMSAGVAFGQFLSGFLGAAQCGNQGLAPFERIYAQCSDDVFSTRVKERLRVHVSSKEPSGRIWIFMGDLISIRAAYGWRAPFVVVGVLFFLCAFSVAARMPEPRRGAFDGRGASRGGELLEVARTPTPVLLFLQGAPGCIPWGVIIVFLNDFLHVDVGLSLEQATTVLTCFSLGGYLGPGRCVECRLDARRGGPAGTAVGGELGQKLYSWKKPAAAMHAAIAELIGIAPLVVIVCAPRGAPFGRLAFLAFVAGTLATQTGPIVKSLLQNTTAPRARASAFAVFALFDDLGKGGGPWVIAKGVRAYGRRTAFAYAVAIGWGLGAAVNACVALTLEKDERKIRDACEEASYEVVPEAPIESALHQRYKGPEVTSV